MDTSFNNTQNLPPSSFDIEALETCQNLERQLEASEARTRCLLAVLPQIVWLAEANGAIAHFNQRWYEYTGLTEVESLGWEFLNVLHPEDRERFVASCNLASKKLQNFNSECRILGLDGTYRCFIGTQTPVMGADGQLLEWVGTYTFKGQPEEYLAASWRESAEAYTVQRGPSQLRGELAPSLAVGNQQPANLRVRKKAVNHTVKLAQQRLRNLVNELSHTIVWEADATTEQFTFVSQSAEGLLGYPVEQWLSQPDFWVNLIHPEDRQWTVALCRKEIFQNRDYELEYRCLAADNRVVWLRDRAYVVQDDQGRSHKRRGLMVDITLTKQAGKELQARLRQQATVAQLSQQLLLGTEVQELINQAVSLVAQTLRVEYCQVLELLPNRNNLRLRAGVGFGQEFMGQATLEASTNTHEGYTLHYRQPVVVEDLRGETRFRGSPWLRDYNIVSSMNVLIDVSANPESWESGSANTSYHPFGVLAVHTSKQRAFSRSDVDFLQSVANVLGAAIASQRINQALYAATTQLTQTTAALNQTTATLKKRTQELDEFAYVTSHDLKAPLRAIANLSQWIEDDIADQLHEENLRQMQLLRQRVDRLESLINGLVEYARAGWLNSEPEQVEVKALLKQVIDTFAPPPQFTIEVAPEIPTLVTEYLPLQQVFAHLIGNAIKHHPSPDGTVKISVQDQLEAYEFAVADDGAGIAPRFHERVFGIFETLKAKETVENIGVGLAIAKRIVESKGGSIRLESQEGQGSTFYFTWPKPLSSS